jgi:hypothetical protein
MANRNGNGRAHVRNRAPQGFGSVRGMCRDPYHIIRLFGPLAQSWAESMGPLRRLVSIVHIHEIVADGVFERGWSQMRVGELMGFDSGP